MPKPWTACKNRKEWRDQVAAKRSVKVDGYLMDVSSARSWWESGYFDSPAEARGAFKLAYQQGLDGMGPSIREWMGLDEASFDAWMRDDTLPSDMLTVEDRKSRVYFVRAGEYVKIGVGLKPTSRIRELQTGSPHELKLIGTVPGGRRLERALHQRFEHIRAREKGEWFYAEPVLLWFIEGLILAATAGIVDKAYELYGSVEEHGFAVPPEAPEEPSEEKP